MFFEEQPPKQQKEYQHFLEIAGSLSNLYSDSKVPYLYYRIAEKLFCRAFKACDLSRGDVSADAKKDGIGIGLKTFLAKNNKTFQKVAEFNSDRGTYIDLDDENLIEKIANLRNIRIDFTERTQQINNSIYHCVSREEGKFKIFESEMHLISIENIQNVKRSARGNTITFNDTINDYSFSLSKSTLSKRFITNVALKEFDIKIFKDPLLSLKQCFFEAEIKPILLTNTMIKQTIYLPLYGTNMKVFEKSGLNHWNASGRDRDANEVYIPIPITIHKHFPCFFPSRDTPFSLILPNGNSMQTKVCQDNSKALMSYSNRELGQWILRDVLNLNEGELLTYEKLELLGVDSVRIDKIDDAHFEINFAKVGSYEKFKKAP